LERTKLRPLKASLTSVFFRKNDVAEKHRTEIKLNLHAEINAIE
jgi:hypothetical protein